MTDFNMIWACPVCNLALTADEAGFSCENKHRYDKARQGYVNLLLANQKNSREPGDDASMIDARRSFLQAGHYDFLIDDLNELILRKKPIGRPQNLLDLGCGEGYYLSQLMQSLNRASSNDPKDNWQALGLDISKYAIKRAAPHLKAASFAVASSHHIPVVSHALDVVMCVFAPLSVAEIKRVLVPGGALVRVTPGAKHLYQLKEQLYAKASMHSAPKMLDGMTVVEERSSIREVVLNTESQLPQLLAMTPFNWAGSQQAKQQIMVQTECPMTFEFNIQVLRSDE
ncbi:MAG: 23S rRNA (guanine745-N1)-methyltransferase [Lentisphaeria bacterium]|jgi:23S rRNA (guanine745-N1)-methyltransferase